MDSPALTLVSSEFSFVSNSVTYSKIAVFRGIGYENSDGPVIAYDGRSWKKDTYKIITLSTTQTVSVDFYNWAITGGNLVKQ